MFHRIHIARMAYDAAQLVDPVGISVESDMWLRKMQDDPDMREAMAHRNKPLMARMYALRDFAWAYLNAQGWEPADNRLFLELFLSHFDLSALRDPRLERSKRFE